MKQEIMEIKKAIKKCWKSLDDLIQCELENLDEQMNEIIVKKLHETNPEKIKEYETKLKYLNSQYIDLFLSKSDEIDESLNVKEDYEELFGDNNK